MTPTKPHTMDYPSLSAVIRELAPALRDARLFRALSAGPLDIVLMLDTPSDRLNLLLSADPAASRAHLVDSAGNPKDSPKLHVCSVLNERNAGAHIESIELVEWERIIRITFTPHGAGDTAEDILYAELMGKHSNIILADDAGKIIASIKAVHAHQSSKRMVRPGLPYQIPPPENKLAPNRLALDDFKALFDSANPGETVAKRLIGSFKAMSPHWAEWIMRNAALDSGIECAGIDAAQISLIHEAFLLSLDEIDAGRPFDIQPANGKFPINAAYAESYRSLIISGRLETRRRALLRIIRDAKKSTEKLASQLEEDLGKMERRDELKRKADSVLAAVHEIPRGASKVEITDISSSDGAKMTVHLDPSIPPAKQAAKWYERYAKLKRGESMTRKHLMDTREKLDVLITAEEEADRAADIPALDVTASRLEAAGIEVMFDKGGHILVRPGAKTYKVLRFRSSDGFDILCGGNQKANDYLTQRLADPNDTWLHAQNMPGSHVVIRTRRKEVPHSTLIDAAHIAAWHSDGREGSKVPVDYTKVKYVRKPPGAKAGYVTYKKQRTIRVDPDESRINRLSVTE